MEDDKIPSETLRNDDGTNTGIQIDSADQKNAVQPNGEYNFNFPEGNFKEISNIGNEISNRVTVITRTILPLIEAALIELLGNSSAFKEKKFVADLTFEGSQPKIEVDIIFDVELYIGTDVNEKSIAADASYILNRVKVVPNVEWQECSINCKDGSVRCRFFI